MQLFQEVTANLLIKIQNLKNAQENLIEVIHRKDVEIDQYKIEGYVLSRSTYFKILLCGQNVLLMIYRFE